MYFERTCGFHLSVFWEIGESIGGANNEQSEVSENMNISDVQL